ncbi:MAG: LacI family DNA-binding transcriptional regulator [Paracoccaceae bacterium]|nr:LacI family DNA-binding transcriptional regulator [Paracoccaceae bacterium]
MRPTIKDLAKAAGVSVSTVNRVINNPGAVRESTQEIVLHAAEKIGFYGLGSIRHALAKDRKVLRLGILLQQGNRVFYRDLGMALRQAANDYAEGKIDLTLEFMDDLSPDHVSERLLAIGDKCDSVALVAAEHPLISDAIDALLERYVPVSGLIAPLTARGNVGYIGLDNWKVGRTAAWAFAKICATPGKVGILVGNHRYRNQDLNESGFRSYFREHDLDFTLLEPRSTYESAAVAREMTEHLLAEHPDMCGLFISGGGITGALAALRDADLRKEFVSVGYELMEPTRKGLIDGTLTLVISHPLKSFARATIDGLAKAIDSGHAASAPNIRLGFEIHTSENI